MYYLGMLLIIIISCLFAYYLKNKKATKIFICLMTAGLLLPVLDVQAADISLNGGYVYIYNYTDNHPIYEKNAEEKIYPASMTKVMTALVALEHMDDLDTVATIEKYDLKGLWEAGASVANFEVGEKVTYRDLIHGILLPSGADACRAVSRILFGSEEAMAEAMNEKAKELGLKNTHFVNTSGLHDDNHYSTVKDMGVITQEALKDDFFREVFCKRSYRTELTNRYMACTLLKFYWNNNVSISHIIGGKTGYTSMSRSCLTCLVNCDGKDIIAVFAKEAGSGKYIADAKTVSDYYTKEYENINLYKAGDVISTINVKDGVKTSYDVITHEDIDVYLPKGVSKEDITCSYKESVQVIAPTTLKQEIGTLEVTYDGEVLKTYEFYMEEVIDATNFAKTIRFVKSHIVEIGCGVAGIAILVLGLKFMKKKKVR